MDSLSLKTRGERSQQIESYEGPATRAAVPSSGSRSTGRPCVASAIRLLPQSSSRSGFLWSRERQANRERETGRKRGPIMSDYVKETAITIDHENGIAIVDTTARRVATRLSKLGFEEITEQPKNSPYRSFRGPEEYVSFRRPRRVSEATREGARRRFAAHSKSRSPDSTPNKAVPTNGNGFTRGTA